jgi:hypothetical protein
MITINPSNSVIIYMMTATNKRLFISESHGDSNRCTPYRGKPDQHATRFPRSVRVWFKTIHISRGAHIATFCKTTTGLADLIAPEKKGSRHNTYHVGWPICDFVPSFSPEPTNEAGGVSQTPVGDQLLGLLVPYHRHAIGTFNTCSRGPTHRSLTDTSGGYNLVGADFPHTTPQPSQTDISTFHLRASPGLQFNQVPSTKSKC